MKLSTRRIIMFSFIFAFFIIGPILLFYASGYRYDTKRQKILKTGTLMLEGKGVSNADIFIDNKLYPDKLNGKIYIYNLLPGDYQIKIEKEGYFPWQKKVTTYSSLTTFAQDIILFKNEVPLQLTDGEISNLYFSADQQKIIYSQTDNSSLRLSYYDQEADKSVSFYQTKAPKSFSLAFAPSAKKILVEQDGAYYVFDLQNPENKIALANYSQAKFSNVIWDGSNDTLLYGQYQNSFYKIDLISKAGVKIFEAAGKINRNFFIDNNDIYYIAESKAANTLKKYNLTFKTDKEIVRLSQAQNYRFVPSSNNYLALIDRDNFRLELVRKIDLDINPVDLNQSRLKEFDAKDAVWDDKQNRLLFYTDFEINIFNTDDNQTTFVNRYGQVIKKAAWYPDLEHVFALIDSNLQIISLSSDNVTKNIMELVKFDALTDFYLNSKGTLVYFAGKIGKQAGLYRLNLK